MVPLGIDNQDERANSSFIAVNNHRTNDGGSFTDFQAQAANKKKVKKIDQS